MKDWMCSGTKRGFGVHDCETKGGIKCHSSGLNNCSPDFVILDGPLSASQALRTKLGHWAGRSEAE